jgi:uncharacterized protein YndB with AHSA1/START domain
MPTTVLTPNHDALITEIFISAPPERVFQAICDPNQQRIWWDKGNLETFEMDARRGGRWRMATKQTAMNINGVSKFNCTGEILEFDPPRVLAYSWNANWHTQALHETVVRWELSPKDGGTMVKVTHSGLAQEEVARKDYQGGWPGVMERLKTYLED